MLTDWIHWTSSLPTERLVVVFAGVLQIDGPRYALLLFLVCLYDYFVSLTRWLRGSPTAYIKRISLIILSFSSAITSLWPLPLSSIAITRMAVPMRNTSALDVRPNSTFSSSSVLKHLVID